MFPCEAAAAALAAACKADSPILTGTTTGELLPVDESKEGVLLLDVEFADWRADGKSDGGIVPTADGSPKRCPAPDRNGAANGNNDDNAAPLRPVSKAEPNL